MCDLRARVKLYEGKKFPSELYQTYRSVFCAEDWGEKTIL